MPHPNLIIPAFSHGFHSLSEQKRNSIELTAGLFWCRKYYSQKCLFQGKPRQNRFHILTARHRFVQNMGADRASSADEKNLMIVCPSLFGV